MAGGGGMGKPAAAEAFDEHVAPALVHGADLVDAILRPVQRGRGRDLDRREGAIIEIRFDARQRADQPFVADREAHAPARHVVGLRQRREFDGDVLGARHLQDRRRRIAVEIELGVGDVRQDDDVELLRERDGFFVEIEADDHRRRIGRITTCTTASGFGIECFTACSMARRKSLAVARRQMPDRRRPR